MQFNFICRVAVKSANELSASASKVFVTIYTVQKKTLATSHKETLLSGLFEPHLEISTFLFGVLTIFVICHEPCVKL